MDATAALEKIKSQMKSVNVEKAIPLDIDLGNLTAYDMNPLDLEKITNSETKEDCLKEVARDNVQLLFNQLFQLPTSLTASSVLAHLPAAKTILPREKPLPKIKAKTRWEKFAQAKGIVKRKKTRMVFDEETEEYKPRYGYKSKVNESMDDWAIEIPNNADPYEDPVAKLRAEKKSRVEKNKKQQRRNAEEMTKKDISEKLTKMTTSGKKNALLDAIAVSRKSTASAGKFVRPVSGEKKSKLFKTKNAQ
ncbi:RRS1-domain-containing protein [Rozella allomycis CSF55]|uniref:Ribosome biogenesis regulatory protein n=1 Tax=Rozella allomycis (strain CSF55) TaxID=988480 RepID=A0A075B223_ROZAC|nr:Ribosomal biogenesis regulatory protein domain-containing protein [Rozella allomycis CSF55]RKP21031.1 RRS1-domain-containing protein [Rozella allomycis CSF55]|eukprot:EPZ35021.1 Ribosomal biogenesis regulatory protein domain-containing protein [Rozella allomycis CSF55]